MSPKPSKPLSEAERDELEDAKREDWAKKRPPRPLTPEEIKRRSDIVTREYREATERERRALVEEKMKLRQTAKVNLNKGPEEAGKDSSRKKDARLEIVGKAMGRLFQQEPQWRSEKKLNKLAEHLRKRWSDFSNDPNPYPTIGGMYSAVRAIRR